MRPSIRHRFESRVVSELSDERRRARRMSERRMFTAANAENSRPSEKHAPIRRSGRQTFGRSQAAEIRRARTRYSNEHHGEPAIALARTAPKIPSQGRANVVDSLLAASGVDLADEVFEQRQLVAAVAHHL